MRRDDRDKRLISEFCKPEDKEFKTRHNRIGKLGVSGRSWEPVWAPQMSNSRLEAVRLPVSAGLPPGERAATLTP